MSMNIVKATEKKYGKGTYLIYCEPGVGKTFSLSFLPGRTLVFDVDRTTRVLKDCENIDIMEVDTQNTWESWENILTDLSKNFKGEYDNIAVDNISELERCLLSDLGRKGKNKGVPSQGDYQYMQFRVVNSLRYMKELGANIIWTAWETTELFTDASGHQWNKVAPQINKKILNNVCGLCDVVGRLTFNSEGKRGFVLMPTNSIYAKNQLDDRKGCLQEELILSDEA